MNSPVKIWRETPERYQHLHQKGKVISWTKINEAPKGFGKFSYTVVMVKLSSGEKTLGQWLGKELPKIGDKVKGVLRRLKEPEASEVIEYGVKWMKL